MKKIVKKKNEKKVVKKVVKSIPKKKKVTTVVKKTTTAKKISKKEVAVSTKKITKNKTGSRIKRSANSVKKKKVTKKAKPNKTLIFAFGDQCFWIKDGPILRDLIDLRNVLYEITQEQFDYHVDAIKNDFAVWVEHVLEDEYTSEVIRKAKSAKSMIDAIHKSLPKKHYR